MIVRGLMLISFFILINPLLIPQEDKQKDRQRHRLLVLIAITGALLIAVKIIPLLADLAKNKI